MEIDGHEYETHLIILLIILTFLFTTLYVIAVLTIKCISNVVKYCKRKTTDYDGCCCLCCYSPPADGVIRCCSGCYSHSADGVTRFCICCYLPRRDGASQCKWCAVVGLIITASILLATQILIWNGFEFLGWKVLLTIVSVPFMIYIITLWIHMIYACANRQCIIPFTCCSSCLRKFDCLNFENTYLDWKRPWLYGCFYMLYYGIFPCYWWVGLCCFVESQKHDIEKGFNLSETFIVRRYNGKTYFEFYHSMCKEAEVEERKKNKQNGKRTWHDRNVSE